MLARNFLTPRQLRLTDAEHVALVGVLGMLERGELVYTDIDAALNYGGPLPEMPFNMGEFCGTCRCIAGWADTLYGTHFEACSSGWSLKAISQSLRELFFVEDDRGCIGYINEVSVAQAAQALRNYLTTGKANWQDVLGR